MYWEGSRGSFPGKRPFALHRNGYAGLQRYGWLWSGDVNSDWKALKTQVMVGISVGLSGIPYWGTDTGGFVATPELTPELYVRWFQFSAFCPSVPFAWPRLETASALGLEPGHGRAQGTGRRLGGELAAARPICTGRMWKTSAANI